MYLEAFEGKFVFRLAHLTEMRGKKTYCIDSSKRTEPNSSHGYIWATPLTLMEVHASVYPRGEFDPRALIVRSWRWMERGRLCHGEKPEGSHQKWV